MTFCWIREGPMRVTDLGFQTPEWFLQTEGKGLLLDRPWVVKWETTAGRTGYRELNGEFFFYHLP